MWSASPPQQQRRRLDTLQQRPRLFQQGLVQPRVHGAPDRRRQRVDWCEVMASAENTSSAVEPAGPLVAAHIRALDWRIRYGPIRVHRGRRREELSLISGALTVLTNAVITYNTWKLNEVIEARRLSGQALPPEEILAHIAPVAFGHINFRGIYRFPLERYVDRLVPSMTAPLKAVGN
jgi:hypothetical protein